MKAIDLNIYIYSDIILLTNKNNLLQVFLASNFFFQTRFRILLFFFGFWPRLEEICESLHIYTCIIYEYNYTSNVIIYLFGKKLLILFFHIFYSKSKIVS